MGWKMLRMKIRNWLVYRCPVMLRSEHEKRIRWVKDDYEGRTREAAERAKELRQEVMRLSRVQVSNWSGTQHTLTASVVVTRCVLLTHRSRSMVYEVLCQQIIHELEKKAGITK